MKGVVYIIKEKLTNKIVYVGQTSMKLSKRWMCHLLDKKPYADRVIQARGGKNAFDCIEVFSSEDQTKLDHIERCLIKQYNTLKPNGLNLEAGGKTQFITDAIKEKMKKASPFKKKVYAVIVASNKQETYESAKEASRQLKCDCSAISAAARGTRATYWKRYWSYKTHEVKIGTGEKSESKKVIASRGDEVYTFPSNSAASRFIGVNTGNIRNVCVGRGNQVQGWSFRYV